MGGCVYEMVFFRVLLTQLRYVGLFPFFKQPYGLSGTIFCFNVMIGGLLGESDDDESDGDESDDGENDGGESDGGKSDDGENDGGESDGGKSDDGENDGGESDGGKSKRTFSDPSCTVE